MTSIIYYPGYSQTTVLQNLRHKEITAITQSYPMVVTTVDTQNYRTGVNVAFLIPPSFGMVQLNGINGNVLSVTDTTMTIDVDSTGFTPFLAPSPLPSAYTPATVYANAEGPQAMPFLPYGNQDGFEGVIYNQGLPR